MDVSIIFERGVEFSNRPNAIPIEPSETTIGEVIAGQKQIQRPPRLAQRESDDGHPQRPAYRPLATILARR